MEKNIQCSWYDNGNCVEHVYEGDKCILHCKKDKWFEIDEKGEQDWSKSENKVAEFWKKFKDDIPHKNGMGYKGYIFPKTNGGDFITAINENFKDNNQYVPKHRMFFQECTFVSHVLLNSTLVQRFEFKKCIFLDGFEASCDLSSNSSYISLNNSKIKKKLCFGDIDFSKVDLTNLIIDTKIVELKNNSYDDVKLKNIQWGDKSRIKADRDEFRQLKFAYDEQANYIEANGFYALEMKARQNELKSIKGHWQDKIVFWLGWLASNHSQYWILPIIWMLVFSNVFYWAAVHCSALEQSLDCYLRFANPFSTKYDDDGLGWWMANKLFFAFLAYHLIVSLRRNTKR